MALKAFVALAILLSLTRAEESGCKYNTCHKCTSSPECVYIKVDGSKFTYISHEDLPYANAVRVYSSTSRCQQLEKLINSFRIVEASPRVEGNF